MARRANNPDAFQTAHYEFEDLIQPVPNDQLFESLQKVEDIGQAAVAQGIRKMDYVAKFIRQDFLSVADIEVDPPLSDDQRARVAGKVEFWGQLLESSTVRKEPRQKPTPTKHIETDNRKR